MKHWLQNQRKNIESYLIRPRRIALLYAFVAFVVLFVSWWYVGILVEKRLADDERKHIATQVDTIGTSLTLAVNQRLTLITSVRSFMEAVIVRGNDFSFDNLNEVNEVNYFVSGLHSSTAGMRNIAIAPSGVMQYVYPYEENKSVLGYEPARDDRSNVREEVRRAIETGEVVLSLPYELIQGGQGLIARQAISVNGNYWGLANVVLDVPPLLQEAGITPMPAGLDLALKDQSGQVFLGSEDVFHLNPVTYDVELPEGSWELAGIPSVGWHAGYRVTMRFYRVMGLTGIVAISLVVYQLINRRERLANLVDRRTHELSLSNQTLITVLEGIDADVYVSDFETSEILFANKHIHESFNDDLVGKKCFQVFRNETSVCTHCNNNKLLDASDQPTGDFLWESHNPITGRWYKNSDRAIRWHDGRYVHLQIATDITEHKQAAEEIQKQMQVQVAFRKAGAAISSTLDIDTVLARIAKEMGQVIDSTSTYINSYEPITKMSSVIAEYIGPGANAEERVPDLDASYREDGKIEFIKLMHAGQHDVAHADEADLSEYERAEMGKCGIQSILYIPLLIRGQLIGYAELWETRQHRDFTSEEITLCQDLAQQAAIALENARSYEQAQREITERIQAEQALQQERNRAEKYLDIAGVMFVTLNAKGEITLINRKGSEILGYEQEEIIGKNWFDSFLPVTIKDQTRAIFDRLMTGEVEPVEAFENPVVTKGGEERIIAWHNIILVDDEDNIIGTLSSGEDITERKQTEDALRESEERYRTLFNSVPVGVYRSTPEGRFLDGNPALMKILGYPDQEIMLAANIRDLYLDESAREQELALIEQDDVVSNHRIQLHRYDGAVIWVQDSVTAVRDNSGQTEYYYGRLEDITERMWTEMELQRANKQLNKQLTEIKELEGALREQAIRDPLTGVFNRRYMDEVLQQELARASRKGGALSMVILDLDHLKEINDTYGHAAGGDKALQTLADTLKLMCRAEDTLCRYGGDEFLVILHDTPAQVAYERAMQWGEAVAGKKVKSGEKEFGITFSAGVAAFPAHGSSAEEILNHADRALYRAKEFGRDQVVVYQKRSSI